jgi:hypothetical protein
VDLKLLALQSQELIRPYLRWCYYRVFPNLRPGYFTDCWRLPAFTPEEAIADALHPVLTAPADRPAVLFLPMVDWHTRIQRSPQLARAFAALGHPCLYLNPHLGRDIVAREHALFESADLIAFSAQLLMDRTLAARPSARAKSVLLRNAVNQSHFTSPAARARDTDRVVGYAGSLWTLSNSTSTSVAACLW